MVEVSREVRSLISFKQDTDAVIRQLKETGQPVLLTVDGKAELVVQDAESYQRLLEIVDRVETIEGIRVGLEELKAGLGRPAGQVFAELRRELEVPREG
jgi:PHD/YefM family antitoxin component YafN of YafNO toxin-antitoxin module